MDREKSPEGIAGGGNSMSQHEEVGLHVAVSLREQPGWDRGFEYDRSQRAVA